VQVKDAAQLAGLLLSMLSTTRVVAYDINEQLSIGGVLAGTIQCQNLSDAPSFSDTCETAVPFQPAISIRPTKADEVFFKLGFAAGNGIKAVTPFVLPQWSADLEDDVTNINGRNRDTLLTAWYRHKARLSEGSMLEATFGIIDATDYLDENAYANDEYTQFMNSALTNGPNVFLPSYDIGAALRWDTQSWSFRGIYMDVGENDDGNNYSFYGLQAGYSVATDIGTGNYRVVIAGASDDFLNPSGTQLEGRSVMLVSLDQAFGQVVGGWIRTGWQSDDSAIDYKSILSGGVDLRGGGWNRDGDNIGLGFAHLRGGNLAVDSTDIAEVYYRWQVNALFGLTADLQYQKDTYKIGRGPSGWTFGLRAVAAF
jgi:hypothetical protein